jgi:hypothetical protein
MSVRWMSVLVGEWGLLVAPGAGGEGIVFARRERMGVVGLWGKKKRG